MKSLLLLLFVLSFASAAYSQSVDELRSSIRTAVESGNFDQALNGLRTIELDHPKAYLSDDLDYLAARLNERSGNLAAAAASYLAVVKRGSVLKSYALMHLAGIARTTGNLLLERTYLDEIAAFSPDSLLADAARNRRARSWFESGNYKMAIRAFESLEYSAESAGGNGSDDVRRENRLFLARSHMLAGDLATAREMFANLVNAAPDPPQPDDVVLAAVRALDSMDRGSAAEVEAIPKLSEGEHLRRASIYQIDRDFDAARLHYSAILADHPGSDAVPDALYQTGRGYLQQGDYPEAINWFERLREQVPEHPLSRDALLQAASAYARVGKHHESVRRYQKFISDYPNEEGADRAYLNTIDALRDAGEETEARARAKRAQEVFRGKLPEAVALFSEVRIDLARSNWDAVLSGIDRLLQMPDLGGVRVPRGTSKPELMFLRGYAFEQKRGFDEAIEAYLGISDGRGEYYGWLATERLRILAEDQASRPAIESKLNSLLQPPLETERAESDRQRVQSALRLTADTAERVRLLETLGRIYSRLPAYRNIPPFKSIELKEPRSAEAAAHRSIARRLASLGLFDEAAPEFEASLDTEFPAAGDLAYTLAALNARGGRAYKAVAFAEPAWRSVPADYQLELIPREQITLLYPIPFRREFEKHAVPRNIDPRFLLSIVRQESRYRPDVKSNAAARGMMQFIPATADKIAAELGLTNLDQDELYDPSTAILFGAHYTANLFGLFPAQPAAVAASYNGGEDNMRRWMNRSRSDIPGRYVPEIAFSQTKDYVYKVMTNYRVYRIFYDEGLRPIR